ncbi:hypothetical protein C8A03DRAFT_38516 [Achaetomium macrosporum]|uniref:Diels-Alderase N-terminal domain-containing protein n=1 Tax=Achaetomium macrosporum TaxID=79813 RepID=A0AAN7C2C8_9PEZI|nr:hypothetical protein C8A03DRAFT_38516 [Achaetomium macrosporum]
MVPAGFRVGIIASWAANEQRREKETVWCSHAALPHSIITSDASGLTGVWRGDDKHGQDGDGIVSFEVAADLSRAVFNFNVPNKVVGTITLTAADGYEDAVPQSEAEAKFMPTFRWLRPIPMAAATAELTFFPE